MMPVMEKLTPSCEIISQKISRSMDGEAALRDRLEIRIHTMGCALCERYRKQLLAMRRILAKYADKIEQADADPIVQLSDEARNRMRHAVRSNREK